MARTVTALISAATIGATASEASDITERTIASTTAHLNLEIIITLPAVQERAAFRLFYAYHATNLGANAAAVAELIHSARIWQCPVMLPPGQAHLFVTEPEWIRGDYLTVWVDCPALGGNATLTVSSIENTL